MTTSPERYDVYLSYNQSDVDAAEHLARQLKAAGVNVWFFPWFIKAGDNWQAKMEDALRRSAHAAVLFGPGGLGPEQTTEVQSNIREAERASRGQFRVIPVLLPEADESKRPLWLKDKYWVDFRAGLNNETAFNFLLASVSDETPPRSPGVKGENEGENVARPDDTSNVDTGDDGRDQQLPSVFRDDVILLRNLLDSAAGRSLALSERKAFGMAATMALNAGRDLDSVFYLAALLHGVPGDSRHIGHSFIISLKNQRAKSLGEEEAAALSVVDLLSLTSFDIFEAPKEINNDYLDVLTTTELGSVIDRAAAIAREAETDQPAVKMRHVIGTILAPPGSHPTPAARSYLKKLSYDVEELGRDFLAYIKEYHSDSYPAWENFVSSAPVPSLVPGGGGQPSPDVTPSATPAPDEEAAQESIQQASVSDQPTAKDTLGFGPYVKAIATFLDNEKTQPPLTLSVEGEWGSGKSSFMLQLQEELRELARVHRRWGVPRRLVRGLPFHRQLMGSPLPNVRWLERLLLRRRIRVERPRVKCLTAEFNPWRHDKEDALWASFALEFVHKLSQGMSRRERLWAHLRLLFRRFSWRGGWLVMLRLLFLVAIIVAMTVALVQLLWAGGLAPWEQALGEDKGAALFRVIQASGVAGYIAFALFFLSKLREFVGNPFAFDLRKYVEAPDYESHIAFIEQFHNDFKKIVETYAGDNKVYVFIDDLDRCDVPKAADLMQAINLMISGGAPQLIFVIGMDREKVAAGLAVKNEKLLPYLARKAARPAEKAGRPKPVSRAATPADESATESITFGLEYGYNFIEKFIQIPFRVPQPAQMGVRTLLDFIAPLVEVASGGGAKSQSATSAQTSSSAPAATGGNGVAPPDTGGTRAATPAPRTPPADPAREAADAEQKVREAAAILSAAGGTQVSATGAETPAEKKDEEKEGLRLFEKGDSLAVRNIVLMTAPALDYNPRRIKQFINLFRLKAYIAYETGLFRRPRPGSPRNSELTLEQLGKFVAIGLRWPRLLADLDDDHLLLQKLQKVANGGQPEPGEQAVAYWRQRPEMTSLMKFGLEGDFDPFDEKKPADPDRYSLAGLNVEKLLQVSPRARRVAATAPQPPAPTATGPDTAPTNAVGQNAGAVEQKEVAPS